MAAARSSSECQLHMSLLLDRPAVSPLRVLGCGRLEHPPEGAAHLLAPNPTPQQQHLAPASHPPPTALRPQCQLRYPTMLSHRGVVQLGQWDPGGGNLLVNQRPVAPLARRPVLGEADRAGLIPDQLPHRLARSATGLGYTNIYVGPGIVCCPRGTRAQEVRWQVGRSGALTSSSW